MVKEKKFNNKNKKDSGKNSVITTIVWLSIAMRYFAGGDPYDISVAHGISHKEVFRSLWRVVDAVIKCPQLAFRFPKEYDKQEEIA